MATDALAPQVGTFLRRRTVAAGLHAIETARKARAVISDPEFTSATGVRLLEEDAMRRFGALLDRRDEPSQAELPLESADSFKQP